MDCIVCGVAKSQTWLSDFHFTGGEGVSHVGIWGMNSSGKGNKPVWMSCVSSLSMCENSQEAYGAGVWMNNSTWGQSRGEFSWLLLEREAIAGFWAEV